MAGQSDTQTEPLPLGKGQEQHMSPTQGQADINGGNPFPAISQPLWGQLYGWLPLSNAYGIPFRCNTIHNQTTYGIFFRCNTIHNQTTYGIPSVAIQHKSNGFRHFILITNTASM